MRWRAKLREVGNVEEDSLKLAGLIVALAIAAVMATTRAGAANAHRDPCHSNHRCPSDHHTYAWGQNRLYCTSYTGERLTSDKIVVRYGGRTYWCHR